MTETAVEFRLFSSRFALLAFTPPRYQKLERGAGCFTDKSCLSPSAEGDLVELCISGGFLVQSGQCDRGKFALMVTQGAGGPRVTVELSDFCPLLLKSTTPSWLFKTLYRLTQAYIHKVVTVRYLIILYRELTGEKVKGKVAKVQVHQGEDI